MKTWSFINMLFETPEQLFLQNLYNFICDQQSFFTFIGYHTLKTKEKNSPENFNF